MVSIDQRSPDKSGTYHSGPENHVYGVPKHPIFIDWLILGERFNSRYLCEKIPEPLSKVLYNRHGVGSPRPIVHFDNSAPHWLAGTEKCFQSCQFRDAPQPPYSSDINPCDFFLFDDLKTKLKGEESESMEKLQDSVKDGLGLVTSETMRRVYELRIARLNHVTHTGWDDV
jgi:hypothetical protein